MDELDPNGDHIPAERSGREVWAAPLTESERQIIENVLREGDHATTRRWLRFTIEILDAQARP